MSVSDLITAAFTEAWRTHGAEHEAWIRVSYPLGAQLPHSLLSMSIQRAGSLDVVLRCMENEQVAAPRDPISTSQGDVVGAMARKHPRIR